MPASLVSAMDMVFELHDTADRLDNQMARKMIEVGIGPDFDMTRYRQVYRLLDNEDQRLRQIHLMVHTAALFHRLCRSRIVRLSFKTVLRATRVLGMAEIVDFIQEGYRGFNAIEDIGPLIQAIHDRELAWHKHIFISTDFPSQPVPAAR